MDGSVLWARSKHAPQPDLCLTPSACMTPFSTSEHQLAAYQGMLLGRLVPSLQPPNEMINADKCVDARFLRKHTHRFGHQGVSLGSALLGTARVGKRTHKKYCHDHHACGLLAGVDFSFFSFPTPASSFKRIVRDRFREPLEGKPGGLPASLDEVGGFNGHVAVQGHSTVLDKLAVKLASGLTVPALLRHTWTASASNG
eukprot:136720-Pelagomonas_calceolata.AAC.1